jgi:hypothetical protein
LVRIVLIGDTVGKPGMRIVCSAVTWLKKRLHARCVVVNAENAADGNGLRVTEYRRLILAGADAITLGDHIYRKREIVEVLESESNIVKPANFPASAPGRCWCVVPIPLEDYQPPVQLAVISLLGRVFMRPVDCPFAAADRVLQELPPSATLRLVDMHAEATSDKQAMGRYLDGRVTAVLGTHTHVTTADECLLPKGTGFQCDVGMSGPFESILGRQIEPVLATTLSFDPNSFHVATGDVRLSGTWFDADPGSGRCRRIGRIQWKEATIQDWNEEHSQLAKRM